MSNETSDTSSGQEDRVITPGGPRSPEMVHAVPPGAAVRMDAGGGAAVVSDAVAVRDVQGDGATRQPSAGGAANALGRALRVTDVPAASDLVATPGGFRPRSMVHQVQPGEALQVTQDRVMLRNLETDNVQEVALTSEPFEPLALGSGWITYAYWNNDTGTPVSWFTTTWQVPPAPATQDNQLIYLFNGLVNNGSNYGILQPVLQWGVSPAGGGPFWSIASWYVLSTGPAFHTTPIPVNPGDVLVGVMQLTGEANGMFSYTSEFQGIAGTTLPVQSIAQLVWCYQTLEAYTIDQCSDYPNTEFTALTAIGIATAGTAPTLNWTPATRVSDCGQHTVVVSNSNGQGEVDLYY